VLTPRLDVPPCASADVLALARDPRCCGFLESTLSRGFIAVFVGSGARAA
jgi:hypothetical protein